MSHIIVAEAGMTEFLWRRIGSYPPTSYSVGWVNDEGPIGGFIIDRYTGKGGSCWTHFAGKPGWITRHKLRQISEYLFDHLECGVGYGVVEASDQVVIDIDKKIGFRELTLLEGHFSGGVDGLLLEMKRSDCRWLARP